MQKQGALFPPEHIRVVLEVLGDAYPYLYDYEPVVMINRELELVWLEKEIPREAIEKIVPTVNERLRKKE